MPEDYQRKSQISAKNLINYSSLSILLAGNSGSIRKDVYPVKYSDRVEELETLIQLWIDTKVMGEKRSVTMDAAALLDILFK